MNHCNHDKCAHSAHNDTMDERLNTLQSSIINLQSSIFDAIGGQHRAVGVAPASAVTLTLHADVI
jgi:hypothetical protein